MLGFDLRSALEAVTGLQVALKRRVSGTSVCAVKRIWTECEGGRESRWPSDSCCEVEAEGEQGEEEEEPMLILDPTLIEEVRKERKGGEEELKTAVGALLLHPKPGRD